MLSLGQTQSFCFSLLLLPSPYPSFVFPASVSSSLECPLLFCLRMLQLQWWCSLQICLQLIHCHPWQHLRIGSSERRSSVHSMDLLLPSLIPNHQTFSDPSCQCAPYSHGSNVCSEWASVPVDGNRGGRGDHWTCRMWPQ